MNKQEMTRKLAAFGETVDDWTDRLEERVAEWQDRRFEQRSRELSVQWRMGLDAKAIPASVPEDATEAERSALHRGVDTGYRGVNVARTVLVALLVSAGLAVTATAATWRPLVWLERLTGRSGQPGNEVMEWLRTTPWLGLALLVLVVTGVAAAAVGMTSGAHAGRVRRVNRSVLLVGVPALAVLLGYATAPLLPTFAATIPPVVLLLAWRWLASASRRHALHCWRLNRWHAEGLVSAERSRRPYMSMVSA